MLAFDKRAARYTWSAVLVLLLLYMLFLLRKTIFVFVLSLLLAYLLHPLVEPDGPYPAAHAHAHAGAGGWPTCCSSGCWCWSGVQIGTRVVEQANTSRKDFPRLLDTWENPSAAAPDAVNSLKVQLMQRVAEQVADGRQRHSRYAALGGGQVPDGGRRSGVRGGDSHSGVLLSEGRAIRSSGHVLDHGGRRRAAARCSRT